jgi:peroxiredoxin
MIELGAQAPDFDLPGTDGRVHSLKEFAGADALLVMFICNHCPYVKHVAAELAKLGRDYANEGVGIVAINSNSADSHPDDSPAKMVEEVKLRSYSFPYLYDETQSIARAYKAACTPDFFLFDGERKLVYRGQLDGSRPGNNIPVSGADLRAAIDALLAGKPVSQNQRPSMGCNIKWKSGNEPDYA